MKKHQLVAMVGTLALAANLLLPNLSFAQQTGTVSITCPAGVFAVQVPSNVTFTPVTSPASGTASTFDVDASDTANLPGGNSAAGGINGARLGNDHLLRIQDQTSGGVNNCGGNTDWFKISAQVTSMTTVGSIRGLVNGPPNGTQYVIPATSMKIVGSTLVNTNNININPGNAALQIDNANQLIYNDYTTTGNLRNTATSINRVDKQAHGGTTAATSAFHTLATYNPLTPLPTGSVNTLDQNVLLVEKTCTGPIPPTGENTDIYTGVAIDTDSGIATLQPGGTYSGTITYTIDQTRPTTCG
jgi:hypothetical protein